MSDETATEPSEPSTSTTTKEEPAVEVDAEAIVSSCHRRSRKIGKLAIALAAAQGEFVTVQRGNTAKVESEKANYSYKYAELSDYMDVARGPLSRHGLAVMQPPIYDANGCVVVETLLVHGESEQWLANELYLMPKDAKPQSIGSAITYARRYAYTAILGMIAEKEDDDGNEAQGNQATFSKGNGGRGRGGSREHPGYDAGPPSGPMQGQPPEQRSTAPSKPPAIPGAAKTQQQVKEQIDAKKFDAAKAQTPDRPQPDGKGPSDLELALKSIEADFPAWSGDAVAMLVQSYGATIEDPKTIMRGSYTEAYKSLRAMYSNAKRSVGSTT